MRAKRKCVVGRKRKRNCIIRRKRRLIKTNSRVFSPVSRAGIAWLRLDRDRNGVKFVNKRIEVDSVVGVVCDSNFYGCMESRVMSASSLFTREIVGRTIGIKLLLTIV